MTEAELAAVLAQFLDSCRGFEEPKTALLKALSGDDLRRVAREMAAAQAQDRKALLADLGELKIRANELETAQRALMHIRRAAITALGLSDESETWMGTGATIAVDATLRRAMRLAEEAKEEQT